MKKAYFQIIAVLVLGLCCVSQMVAQGVVGTLRIQGTLKSNNGQPVNDGNYALTFKIYTSETGGTAIWTETQPAVNIIGGVYSVVLGSVSPCDSSWAVTCCVSDSRAGRRGGAGSIPWVVAKARAEASAPWTSSTC